MNSRKHSHPWFKETFGFEECSYYETKQHFKLSSDGTELTSLRNNRKFHVGLFEVLSHKDLHARKVKLKDDAGKDLGGLIFSNISGSVESLIKNMIMKGLFFKPLLSLIVWKWLVLAYAQRTVSHGINLIASQGPACALACPAGTLYRNYFVNKGRGQAAPGNQINTLDIVEEILGDTNHSTKGAVYWHVKNGYCMPLNNSSMSALNERLGKDATLAQKFKTT